MTYATASAAWRYHVKCRHRGLPNLSECWLDQWWEDCEQILRRDAPHLANAASNAPGYVDFLLGRGPRA